ncbi:DUF2059 domain-containing protein [Sphingopyxis indica]|uniref:DUF2059 domain-containing protein n=1 Tax=Sphingopyxis indica TaxID=436663 RepID=A0A239L876_9SPHN|nr:DUF2059 domain-containing protein [Sphingopyxis indica]SNT26525.1 hypothetical protein SAMN06295955_12027 [Sphingopyxis indica]
MSTWKSTLLAGTFALTPLGSAIAQEEAPNADVVHPHDDSVLDADAGIAEAKAKMQKEMDEVIALIEQMFGTDDLPPIEPARLALAEQTTAALVPSGSLERLMDNLYGKMFKTIMDQADGSSDLMLSIKTGVESDKIAELDKDTKTAIADLFDPHRKEREEQITRVVKPLISEALADLEPPMREGMAKAYARKFSAEQLGELNAFFATPTGRVYTEEWMAAQADPEVVLAMAKAIPPMVLKFIDRAPEISKDFEDLPKERALADLSDAEMKKLAKMMKVDVKTLQDNRDMWSETAMDAIEADEEWSSDDQAVDAAADAAEDAEAAADAAADAAEDASDPAFDRDNWSDADRQRVEELETAAANASAAAYEAEDAAIAAARERLGQTDPSE